MSRYIPFRLNTILTQDDVDEIKKAMADGIDSFRLWTSSVRQISKDEWETHICLYSAHWYKGEMKIRTKFKPTAEMCCATRWYLSDLFGQKRRYGGTR